MLIKDKLAATLLNHWYVIERGLETHRLKKVPHSEDLYSLLDNLDKSEDEVEKILEKFAAYNSSGFVANIEKIISDDKDLEELKIQTVVERQKVSVKATATLENVSDIDKLIRGMGGPNQDPAVKIILEHLPSILIATTEDKTALSTSVVSGFKTAHQNLADVERDFMRRWSALKILAIICLKIKEAISEEDLKEIVAGRAHINFKNAHIDNASFKADKFEVVETPEAKASRLIKERLEAALKRRIKNMTVSRITEDAVEYKFEDEQEKPLTINLDIITRW